MENENRPRKPREVLVDSYEGDGTIDDPYAFIGAYLARVEDQLVRGKEEALCWVLSQDFEDFILAWEFSVELSVDYWRRKLVNEWTRRRSLPWASSQEAAQRLSSGCFWYTSRVPLLRGEDD